MGDRIVMSKKELNRLETIRFAKICLCGQALDI